MLKSLLPKEYRFYDFFENHIDLVYRASVELQNIDSNGSNLKESVKRIKDLEHQADNITHECTETLHKTFITPFERTDIYSLIKKLDDIIDSIDSAASRMALYDIKEVRHETRAIAVILIDSALALQLALKGLRNLKTPNYIKEKIIQVRELESKCDVLFKDALLRLFKENDAMQVIKWKEIFERLEKAVDRCEDAANIIEGILIDNA
jgi:predicted phosphate transport protein (TIGR00153 family)